MLAFLVTYQEDIHWERISNGEKLRRELTDELKRFNLDNNSLTPESIVNELQMLIRKGETQLH